MKGIVKLIGNTMMLTGIAMSGIDIWKLLFLREKVMNLANKIEIKK